MNDPEAEPDDAETGLPLLRSWPAVYVFVVGSFCLWVLGLLTLSYLFR